MEINDVSFAVVQRSGAAKLSLFEVVSFLHQYFFIVPIKIVNYDREWPAVSLASIVPYA